MGGGDLYKSEYGIIIVTEKFRKYPVKYDKTGTDHSNWTIVNNCCEKVLSVFWYKLIYRCGDERLLWIKVAIDQTSSEKEKGLRIGIFA